MYDYAKKWEHRRRMTAWSAFCSKRLCSRASEARQSGGVGGDKEGGRGVERGGKKRGANHSRLGYFRDGVRGGQIYKKLQNDPSPLMTSEGEKSALTICQQMAGEGTQSRFHLVVICDLNQLPIHRRQKFKIASDKKGSGCPHIQSPF